MSSTNRFVAIAALGYDTIVGAKGGELQLTLNTVYYLSQPVENLPFEFYRQFLPAEARRDREAVAGEMYEDRIEVRTGDIWTDVSRPGAEIVIPKGQSSVELRVPLFAADIEGPREFTLAASVVSQNTVNRSALAVGIIEPGSRRAAEIESINDHSEPNASADVDEETDLGTDGQVTEGAEVGPDEPVFELDTLPAFSKDPFCYFRANISRPIEGDVRFGVTLQDGADGRYMPYLAENKVSAIPVCLGDYYRQYRVVGTTADFFDLVFDRTNKRGYEFAEGGKFTGQTEGYGVFEAILGSKVARDVGKNVGDTIQPSHGAPDGEAHQAFVIVGVLKPSGTPQDRAVFVNLEGFNQIPDHIRDDGLKEVTALLVDTKDAFRSMQLDDRLANEPVGQVVKPVKIIFNLFNSIVGPLRNLLLAITAMICVVSGISILVSIYNSMNDRKHEIAVMRSLGAGRGTVMTVVLLESVMISLAGGILGWLGGHGLIGLASHKIEAETGVVVSAFQLAPPMEELSYLLGPRLTPNISVEIWLLPCLVFLAIIVGFMPALSAYRTDVAKALQSSP